MSKKKIIADGYNIEDGDIKPPKDISPCLSDHFSDIDPDPVPFHRPRRRYKGRDKKYHN